MFSSNSQPSKEARAKTWGQEPGGKNWSGGQRGLPLTDLLLMAWSVCILIAAKTTSPEVSLPTWARPFHIDHQSRKCTADLPEARFHGIIFSAEAPSSTVYDPSWCQIDTKPASTAHLRKKGRRVSLKEEDKKETLRVFTRYEFYHDYRRELFLVFKFFLL